MTTISQQQLDAFKTLPSLPNLLDPAPVPKFAALRPEETGKTYSAKAVNDHTASEVWMQTGKISINLVRRIRGFQLFGEIQEKVPADDSRAGQWAWAEVAILTGPDSDEVKEKDGVQLVWSALDWQLPRKSLSWAYPGRFFDENHAFLRLIEDGDTIGVRLCAKYNGHGLTARSGYLVFDLTRDPVARDGIDTTGIVASLNNTQNTLDLVNVLNEAPYRPSMPDGLRRADQLGSGDARPLRVLAFDGGGVRGLASLYLLKAALDKTGSKKKPCQIFDMIGGTSTGGLIAIMLGRLKMTVDEAIQAYNQFMDKVFDESWWQKTKNFAKTGAEYDASKLVQIIKDLIRQRLPDENPDDVTLLEENPECLVFCTTVYRDAANNRAPVILRSYSNPLEMSLFPNIKLWQVARATSAAPTYFTAMTVDGYAFIDGGLQANNPLGWLWTEVQAVFGPVRASDCILSIGTGIPSNTDLNGLADLAKNLSGVATNTELTNVLFRTLIDAYAPQSLSKKYWRLNVGRKVSHDTNGKLGDYAPIPQLDDYKAMPDFIKNEVDPSLIVQEKAISDIAMALLAHLDDTKPQVPVNTPSSTKQVIKVL